MKRMILGALAVAALAMPATMLPAPAMAQDWHNRGDNRGNDRGGDYSWRGNGNNNGWEPSRSYREDRRYRERRLGRNDSVYRGGDGRYYCRRNDGTTGLVIGAIGGGVLGNVVGGGTLGTLLGAGGGALLGRSIDRGQVRCR
jgi:hypothetical protein